MNAAYFAKDICPKQLHQAPTFTLCMPLIAHLCHHSCFPGYPLKQACLLNGVGEWLLAVDMLAQSHGHHCRMRVCVVRGGNRYRIDAVLLLLEHDP
jgi:hypothetical protein